MVTPEPENNDAAVEKSGTRTPGNVAFVCSLVFSLGPLVIGVSIFLLWVLTRAGILEFLGFVTTLGGLFSVFVAFLSLISYFIAAVAAKERAGKVALRVVIMLAAIISNFPSAWACLAGQAYIRSFYVLTVENRSSATIQQVSVSGCGANRSVGPLQPGGKDTVKFRVTAEGSLVFSAGSNGRKIVGVLEEYVTPDGLSGSQRTLAIKDGGTYVVEGIPPFVD